MLERIRLHLDNAIKTNAALCQGVVTLHTVTVGKPLIYTGSRYYLYNLILRTLQIRSGKRLDALTNHSGSRLLYLDV
jgi:hypothetical protein